MASDAPTQIGLPSRQPRDPAASVEPASGSSSSSGAASSQGPQVPPVERTLRRTDPLPCQRRPTRSNLPGVASSERSPFEGSDRDVSEASPADAETGAARAIRATMAAISGFTAEARSQGDGGYACLQGIRPHPDRILTSVRGPHLRGFLLTVGVVSAVLCLNAANGAVAAAGTSRVLVAKLDDDINPVSQRYLQDQVRRARSGGYQALVVELDTPG